MRHLTLQSGSSKGVNIVIVGHVDHGKSTLIGRLLYDSKNIMESKVKDIQRIAQEYKRRFEFAYFLDSLEEEIKESKTIETTQVVFKGKRNDYTIIDTPGHKEFLKNMLTGASYADAAVIVVSAKEGVREQTRRHLFLLSFLQIKQIFICINKMDRVGYQAKSFLDLKQKVSEFLKQLNYEPQTIPFIPVSAFKGDNIYKRSSNMNWYKGLTLIDTLDASIKKDSKSSFLRFVVQDVYKAGNENIIAGRVESGTLKENDRVIFCPSGVKTRIKEIRVFEGRKKKAQEGDSIGIVLEDDKKIERGEVCGAPDYPPLARKRFLGEIVLLFGKTEEGESFVIKCGTKKTTCKINKIIKRIDSQTGRELKRKNRGLKANEAALIDLGLSEPMVLEEYSKVPALGRFILEKNNKNIAAGIVLENLWDV